MPHLRLCTHVRTCKQPFLRAETPTLHARMENQAAEAWHACACYQTAFSSQETQSGIAVGCNAGHKNLSGVAVRCSGGQENGVKELCAVMGKEQHLRLYGSQESPRPRKQSGACSAWILPP